MTKVTLRCHSQSGLGPLVRETAHHHETILLSVLVLASFIGKVVLNTKVIHAY